MLDGSIFNMDAEDEPIYTFAGNWKRSISCTNCETGVRSLTRAWDKGGTGWGGGWDWGGTGLGGGWDWGGTGLGGGWDGFGRRVGRACDGVGKWDGP